MSQSSKKIYSIGELVKYLNINKETIRYYEKTGLLSYPARNKSGYRIYTEEDIEKIKFILITKNLGFSLKEINILLNDKILSGSAENIKQTIKDKLHEIQQKIKKLEQTQKLLQKVNDVILSGNNACSLDIESYLEK